MHGPEHAAARSGEGSVLQIPTPIPLDRLAKPFDDPNWIFEIKHDGFRALALIEKGHCWLVSRRKHKFYAFGDLATAIGREVQVDMAILDGELAVSDEHGRSGYASIMKRRQDVRYYAFDLLWLNGKDLRRLPLLARKQMLNRLLPEEVSARAVCGSHQVRREHAISHSVPNGPREDRRKKGGSPIRGSLDSSVLD